MKKVLFILSLFILNVNAKEYHVSPKGSDINNGSVSYPFKTINRAAQIAMPNDTITVHEGVYREWINPVNGGRNDEERILYRAAKGEKVEIKGSELVKGWTKVKNSKDVWMVTVPNSLFGCFNPFQENIYGDWLYDTTFHRGDVYLNDQSLYEAKSLEEVLKPKTIYSIRDKNGYNKFWFSEVKSNETVIYANFGDFNPNKETVEITVRPTCFYPTREGVNYITFRGFYVGQAATQWGAPTDEQIGIVSTHWSKGWIIEDNIINNSRCIGICLGKERSTGHNLACNDKRLDGTSHYMEVIFNTLRNGWNKERIGSHIVRNNIISNCEQGGIIGSMGGAFSEIYGNHIFNINAKQQFFGAEIAGIKLHGAIDTYIHNNRIHDTGHYAIWLDWMAQGARISSNLMYRCKDEDVFIEVSHGPIIIDNNIMLSKQSFRENSDGISFIHNLFSGNINRFDDTRYVPYNLEHSTEIKGIKDIKSGDHRFYNNIFLGHDNKEIKYGLSPYDVSTWPIYSENNIFGKHAFSIKEKKQDIIDENFNPQIIIEETGNEVFLIFNKIDFNKLNNNKTEIINTKKLGKTKLSNYLFENPDGSDIVIDKDYFGKPRSQNPAIGPFEFLSEQRIKVW